MYRFDSCSLLQKGNSDGYVLLNNPVTILTMTHPSYNLLSCLFHRNHIVLYSAFISHLPQMCPTSKTSEWVPIFYIGTTLSAFVSFIFNLCVCRLRPVPKSPTKR